MGFFSRLFGSRKPKKVNLGLALGSGGAKGYAELGALKAFEENGIEFDCIAGTSIGSIIGAFYADGYSVTDIFELLKSVDFSEVRSFFMIRMDTSGLFQVIDRYIGSLTIEELRKPFRAVATHLETGDEYVFDKGSVASALCASSSYPPFFKPVVIDGERYIDGAFSNSVPADVARSLGADYVVGIDLANHNEKPGFLSRIFPTYQSKVKEPWAKGYEFSDVVIHPDLKDFRAISISQSSKMYEIGYQAAVEILPEIMADIENLKKGAPISKTARNAKKAKKQKNKPRRL